jgi:hypothetical protein
MNVYLALIVLALEGCRPGSTSAPSSTETHADGAATANAGSGTAQVASAAPSATAGVAAETDELNSIREATLRYMMNQRASLKVFCIAINNVDPPDTFLQRFDSRIRATSKCSKDPVRLVRDLRTGALGVVLDVGTIQRGGPASATIEGGHYQGGRSSSRSLFTLEKTAEGWTVTKEKTLFLG